MHRHTILVAVLLSFTACKKKADPPKTDGSGTAAAGTAAGTGAGTGSAGTGSAAGSDVGSGSAAGAFDPGELQTPESALYDSGRDMYMVSNINGKPHDADDNGYLMVVNPDGSNERANANWKWIDGSAPDIKLDAPKGMAISGDTLYVADITVVRRFEAKAGKQLDDIKIDGAVFLNDVVSDGDGGVFVSDTSIDASFKSTGNDAVYHVAKDGKVTARIKDKGLGGPNGLYYDKAKQSLWVVTFGSGEIYEVDAKGKKGTPQKLPKGGLDGITAIDGGELLVSSWEGKCVFRGKPGGEWKEVAGGIESPADIDYDPKRKKIIVPVFTGNKVQLQVL
jgi:sugar lactone lactonase YvrE